MAAIQMQDLSKVEINLREPLWELYDKYLHEMSGAWAPSTYKSEASRLKLIVKLMLSGAGRSGNALYDALMEQGLKMYAVKTSLIRASQFWEYGKAQGHFVGDVANPYKSEMRRKAFTLKTAYKKERLKFNYDQALAAICGLAEEDLRDFILAMLKSGVRFEEAFKVDLVNQRVIGKGSKERAVVFEYYGTVPAKARVRAALKQIGLKPHSLRKLLATKLSRTDMTHADIMAVFGWSSIKTADSYFQPLAEDKLRQLLKEATK